MSKNVTLFGAKFCIPRGYKLTKNFQLEACPVRMPKEKEDEYDIMELNKDFGGRIPTEAEVKAWVDKKNNCRAIYSQIQAQDKLLHDYQNIKIIDPDINILIKDATLQKERLEAFKAKHCSE